MVHRLILGAGKYIVENIANANCLPATGCYTLALPIKSVAASESPIRLIALCTWHIIDLSEDKL